MKNRADGVLGSKLSPFLIYPVSICKTVSVGDDFSILCSRLDLCLMI